MYPSDYGYATSGGSAQNRAKCLNDETSNWSNNKDCIQYNWLYNSVNWQWTMTPIYHSANASVVGTINNNGIVYNYDAYNALAVSPTLYFKKDIKIINGIGTIDEAYELAAQKI